MCEQTVILTDEEFEELVRTTFGIDPVIIVGVEGDALPEYVLSLVGKSLLQLDESKIAVDYAEWALGRPDKGEFSILTCSDGGRAVVVDSSLRTITVLFDIGFPSLAVGFVDLLALGQLPQVLSCEHVGVRQAAERRFRELGGGEKG